MIFLKYKKNHDLCIFLKRSWSLPTLLFWPMPYVVMSYPWLSCAIVKGIYFYYASADVMDCILQNKVNLISSKCKCIRLPPVQLDQFPRIPLPHPSHVLMSSCSSSYLHLEQRTLHFDTLTLNKYQCLCQFITRKG
jgi:hypothetical protein